MPLRVRIENVAELAHGEARSFKFERQGETQDGFIMRHDDAWVAYRNWCPHWGVDLDMGSNKFYAKKVDRIYCKNHGALFRPGDGYCDAGPCATQRLEAFDVTIDGADALIDITDLPPAVFD